MTSGGIINCFAKEKPTALLTQNAAHKKKCEKDFWHMCFHYLFFILCVRVRVCVVWDGVSVCLPECR